jgi:ribosomal protein S14
MKYHILKDRRHRIIYSYYERRRKVLLSIVHNLSLSTKVRLNAYKALLTIPRQSSITQRRNRCTLTGRSRAIYRRFGLSRLRFRKLA